MLRPGGELVFLGNSTLLILCMPDADEEAATERLLRPQFGLHRADWSDGTVNFYSATATGSGCCTLNGFEVFSTSSSCGRGRMRPPSTPSSPGLGPANGRVRRPGASGWFS